MWIFVSNKSLFCPCSVVFHLARQEHPRGTGEAKPPQSHWPLRSSQPSGRWNQPHGSSRVPGASARWPVALALRGTTAPGQRFDTMNTPRLKTRTALQLRTRMIYRLFFSPIDVSVKIGEGAYRRSKGDTGSHETKIQFKGNRNCLLIRRTWKTNTKITLD